MIFRPCLSQFRRHLSDIIHELSYKANGEGSCKKVEGYGPSVRTDEPRRLLEAPIPRQFGLTKMLHEVKDLVYKSRNICVFDYDFDYFPDYNKSILQ